LNHEDGEGHKADATEWKSFKPFLASFFIFIARRLTDRSSRTAGEFLTALSAVQSPPECKRQTRANPIARMAGPFLLNEIGLRRQNLKQPRQNPRDRCDMTHTEAIARASLQP
jgi:hypothetical protein